MEKSFRFSVPLEILEKDEQGYKIRGVCSTEREDLQGEIVRQNGLDFSHIKKGLGLFNWNHKNDPKYILGKINKMETKGNKSFVEGYLFDKVDNAKAIVQIMQSLKPEDKHRVQMSIEGKIAERGGSNNKEIRRAKVERVALTMDAVNPDTYVDLAKSLMSDDEIKDPVPLEEEKIVAITGDPEDVMDKSIESVTESKDEEVGEATLDSILNKAASGSQKSGHQYIRREGTPGNYKYWYRDASGKEYQGDASGNPIGEDKKENSKKEEKHSDKKAEKKSDGVEIDMTNWLKKHPEAIKPILNAVANNISEKKKNKFNIYDPEGKAMVSEPFDSKEEAETAMKDYMEGFEKKYGKKLVSKWNVGEHKEEKKEEKKKTKKEEETKKTMTVGYSGADAPTSRSGGAALAPESLDGDIKDVKKKKAKKADTTNLNFSDADVDDADDPDKPKPNKLVKKSLKEKYATLFKALFKIYRNKYSGSDIQDIANLTHEKVSDYLRKSVLSGEYREWNGQTYMKNSGGEWVTKVRNSPKDVDNDKFISDEAVKAKERDQNKSLDVLVMEYQKDIDKIQSALKNAPEGGWRLDVLQGIVSRLAECQRKIDNAKAAQQALKIEDAISS